MMKSLFSPASTEDLIRLLRAWRFWVLAALVGVLSGWIIYSIAPPPFRARATVNVDFNLEEAWPRDTDRQQFYYLERETRKLEELAWSDAVMEAVAVLDGKVTVSELRENKLQLSQPGEAGWHFYADDTNAQRAASLASAWANAFVEISRSRIKEAEGLNSFIEIEITQAANLPVERSVPLGAYLLAGAIGAWFIGALIYLFFDRKPSDLQGV